MFAVLMLLICSLSTFSFAADKTEVYVTISDGSGKIVLAQEKITLTDTDCDGALTVDDALYIAHESRYTGGAAAGYKSSVGSYGKSLDKLWGVENGGSYGYYVNNISAMSLDDIVNNGDYIYAYAFSDLASWSDTYCFFDVNTLSAQYDKEYSLTLSAAAFDASWNPITVPVADAVITVDGKATAFKTDSNGKATIKLYDNGKHIISATSSSMTLVPPVLIATVTGAPAPAPVPTPTPQEKIPDTGSFESVTASASVFGACAITFLLILKKKNEK